MSNTIIPKKQMLKASQLDPLSKWHRLNTNHWIHDWGLIKILNSGNGNGSYYVTDKGRKKLWDLLTYCSDTDARIIMDHYGFPEPRLFPFFLKWVYNNVAADLDWKENTEKDQMDFFPYKILWDLWFENIGSKILEKHEATHA
jgi:hypothetical protein